MDKYITQILNYIDEHDRKISYQAVKYNLLPLFIQGMEYNYFEDCKKNVEYNGYVIDVVIQKEDIQIPVCITKDSALITSEQNAQIIRNLEEYMLNNDCLYGLLFTGFSCYLYVCVNKQAVTLCKKLMLRHYSKCINDGHFNMLKWNNIERMKEYIQNFIKGIKLTILLSDILEGKNARFLSLVSDIIGEKCSITDIQNTFDNILKWNRSNDNQVETEFNDEECELTIYDDTEETSQETVGEKEKKVQINGIQYTLEEYLKSNLSYYTKLDKLAYIYPIRYTLNGESYKFKSWYFLLFETIDYLITNYPEVYDFVVEKYKNSVSLVFVKQGEERYTECLNNKNRIFRKLCNGDIVSFCNSKAMYAGLTSAVRQKFSDIFEKDGFSSRLYFDENLYLDTI